MNDQQQKLKQFSLIAFAAMVVQLVASVVFIKERMLFADATYAVFNIVSEDKLKILNHRYGEFVIQIFPFLAAKFHLPLKVALWSCGISFNLFYVLVAGILVFRLRQYGLSILMALYYFLFVSASFICVSDVSLGIAWMFLLFGLTMYMGGRDSSVYKTLVPFVLLAFVTVATHFVLIIPIVFLWVYLLLDQKNWPFDKRNTIMLSSGLVAVMLFKYALEAGAKSYDSEHLRGVTHFSIKDIINSVQTPVVATFLYRCFTNYWVAVALFIAGVVVLFNNGQRRQAYWTLIATAGYLIIMGLAYADLDKNVLLFHIEIEWSSLAVIVATPFVFAVLPRISKQHGMALLSAVFIVRCIYIGEAIPAFSWRVAFQERVLAQMRLKNISKLALYYDDSIGKKYMLEWGAPYESIAVSAMHGDTPPRTFMFVHADKADVIASLKKTDAVYLFGITQLKDLRNNHYFSFDTLHPYVLMTAEQLFNKKGPF